MKYQVRYDRSILRQLAALPGDIRSIARKQIEALIRNPQLLQAKELEDHPSHYRIWLPRTHRLIYRIIEDEQIVDILYVGPKSSDLYAKLGLGRN